MQITTAVGERAIILESNLIKINMFQTFICNFMKTTGVAAILYISSKCNKDEMLVYSILKFESKLLRKTQGIKTEAVVDVSEKYISKIINKTK